MALTDRNNLFALVKFYETSLSKGLKPILGAELWITPEQEGPAARVVALAQDTAGYKNLLALISNSYIEADRRGENYRGATVLPRTRADHSLWRG